jgi:hypothetical protein
MAKIYAMLDNKGEVMTGDRAPFEGALLISAQSEALEKYRDALPYSVAKHMNLVAFTPSQQPR